MDAIEVMRATGACRRFRPDPVPDAVLARVFDAARFGPQGGNRQPVRSRLTTCTRCWVRWTRAIS